MTRTDLFDFPTTGGDDFNFGAPFEFISAGEVITFTSPAGTYIELNRTTFGDIVGYSTDTELPRPAPSGLLVDIPGDDYPAFSNVSIPDVAALQLTAPADSAPVTPNTQFTWTAATGSDSAVDISTSFTDIANMENVSVNCTVVDDGSFSFDSATQAAMGSSFSGLGLFASRVAYSFRQTGTTVLVVSHTIDNN